MTDQAGDVQLVNMEPDTMPTTVEGFWGQYVLMQPEAIRTNSKALKAMKTVFYTGFSAAFSFFTGVIGNSTSEEAEAFIVSLDNELKQFGGIAPESQTTQ